MLNFMRRVFHIIVVFTIIAFSQNGAAGSSAETTAVIEAFSGSDVNRALSAINDAKELPYQGEMIRLMQELWDGERFDERISIELIKKDVVRINIADFLVQASKNGLTEIDITQFHTYARETLKSADPEAVSSAFFVLAHIDDPQDVEFIKPFVLSESDYLFRSSTLSLAMMCNDASDEALIDLSQGLAGSKRDYLENTRKKFDSLKKKGYYCR